MMLSKSNSCCCKCLSVLSQLPYVSVAFLVLSYIVSIGTYRNWMDIETAWTDQFNELDVHKWLLLGLIGVWVVNTAITFQSFVSAEWVYTACLDNLVTACGCCTKLSCNVTNWVLLALAYLLAIVYTIAIVPTSIVVFFGVLADGICTGTTQGSASLEDTINDLLKVTHDFVCNDLNTMIGCKAIPEQLPEDVDKFCTTVEEAIEGGFSIFVFLLLAAIAQWSFVAIQRANLVESAARRGFADERAENQFFKEDPVHAAEAGAGTGPIERASCRV